VKSRLLAAGIAVLALATAAAAQPVQTFTVIDRTMVCTTAFEGGVPDRLRSLSIGAGRELGQGSGESGAWIALGTGKTGSLVYVAADDASSGPGPWLQITRRRCTTVKTPLRPAHEERTAATIEFSARCKLLDAPPRVLVRLRASMQSRTRWSVYKREYLVARGNPLEASVTVRSYPARKPLLFASFARDGSARFFRTPRCT
jgi:hypothetical protein